MSSFRFAPSCGIGCIVVLVLSLSACGSDGSTEPDPGNGGGGGGGSNTLELATPSGLTSEALSGSRTRLTWTDNSDDEIGVDGDQPWLPKLHERERR